ncbi:MAG TPA: PIN domain-containing protein [Thermoanaerobaculia bacterium]|nr:PIN domain-containing protein [Thermoanaerobaculia bacterium]
MSSCYFADTWYFVALIKRDDKYHDVAKQIATSLNGAKVITTDAVLIELLNYVSESGAALRHRAGEFVHIALEGGAAIEVIEQNRGLFRNALERYRNRADKGYSLVDCMSMCIMDARAITHAITDDRHFEQERFVAVRGPLSGRA